jgi:hypothetical protein
MGKGIHKEYSMLTRSLTILTASASSLATRLTILKPSALATLTIRFAILTTSATILTRTMDNYFL